MATHPVTANMTDEELERHAFQVLLRELGFSAYARFLPLFCSGKGDYTADRHQWFDGLTVEDIVRDMQLEPPTTP